MEFIFHFNNKALKIINKIILCLIIYYYWLKNNLLDLIFFLNSNFLFQLKKLNGKKILWKSIANVPCVKSKYPTILAGITVKDPIQYTFVYYPYPAFSPPNSLRKKSCSAIITLYSLYDFLTCSWGCQTAWINFKIHQ